MRITPNNTGLGARIHDIDLSAPLSPEDFRGVLRALGEYGVLCFPAQNLDAPALSAYGSRFGALEVNVANMFHAPGLPEVMLLSNKRDAAGKPDVASGVTFGLSLIVAFWLFGAARSSDGWGALGLLIIAIGAPVYGAVLAAIYRWLYRRFLAHG